VVSVMSVARFGFWGLGFGVGGWGFGFGVGGWGFGDWGLRFGVWGLGFEVWILPATGLTGILKAKVMTPPPPISKSC